MCDKSSLDRAGGSRRSPARYVLGALTVKTQRADRPGLLSVVALLADVPAEGLKRGQVGTIVETLDDETVLVEFSDDRGRAYAVVPCAISEVMTLRYEPQTA
jgi:Domain of unknown function (DUF4926)